MRFLDKSEVEPVEELTGQGLHSTSHLDPQLTQASPQTRPQGCPQFRGLMQDWRHFGSTLGTLLRSYHWEFPQVRDFWRMTEHGGQGSFGPCSLGQTWASLGFLQNFQHSVWTLDTFRTTSAIAISFKWFVRASCDIWRKSSRMGRRMSMWGPRKWSLNVSCGIKALKDVPEDILSHRDHHISLKSQISFNE